jgi:phytoene dehydrogenase-like protein
MSTLSRRAVVIGAGPNGLAAAIVLAQAGLQVEVFEAESVPGGGARTLELTLPGFLHDFGSAVHPMAAGSPFFHHCRSPGWSGSIRQLPWLTLWTMELP